MNKQELREEVEELQEVIESKISIIKKYVDKERDTDAELELGFDNLEIMSRDFNNELDEFFDII